MAWTAPMTAVANSVFTAAQFNTHVRDNLNETAPAKATTAGSLFVAAGVNSIAERTPAKDTINTEETTTSISFTDLATSGPSVSVVTSTNALIIIGARMSNNTGGEECWMAYETSGASAFGAAESRAINYESSNAGDFVTTTIVDILDTLTPGTNVFTAKYRVTGGTGTFRYRRLQVIPL